MISLIPVIEFEPARYATRERQPPPITAQHDTQAWEAYWRASLSDAGIDELHPFRPGGWQVPITQLVRPSTLRTILEAQLKHVETADTLATFPGGYILASGEIAIGPGCCSDLSTLD